MKKFAILALPLLVALLPAQTTKPTSRPSAEKAFKEVAAYPIDTCVVSGEELKEGKAKSFEVNGRTVKTCCGKCQKKVEGDPETYLAKLDEAIVAAQIASYPLETCPVTNRALGDSSKNVVLGDTLVRVCCGKCAGKAPEMAEKLKDAVKTAAYEAQQKNYTAKTCPVSGEDLGDGAVDVMVRGKLLRLCCEDCAGELEKNPGKYVSTLAKKGEMGKQDEKGKGADAPGKSDKESAESCCGNGAAAGCCQGK